MRFFKEQVEAAKKERGDLYDQVRGEWTLEELQAAQRHQTMEFWFLILLVLATCLVLYVSSGGFLPILALLPLAYLYLGYRFGRHRGRLEMAIAVVQRASHLTT